MIDLIIQDFHLKEEDIKSIFTYGSRVYGTNHDKSDYDFIVVANVDNDSMDSSTHNINVTIYKPESLQDLINRHRISALECFFLPEDLRLKNDHKFEFKLDKQKLRSSISEKSSNSWVKAKKKFEVEKDKNIYVGKKSLFHSLRMIDFGMQIGKYGKIKSYYSCNYLWEEIFTNPSEDWNDYKIKYQELYNNQMTEFRKICPK